MYVGAPFLRPEYCQEVDFGDGVQWSEVFFLRVQIMHVPFCSFLLPPLNSSIPEGNDQGWHIGGILPITDYCHDRYIGR